jgi:hypothetical protein
VTARILAMIALLAAASMPARAFACSVCFAGRENTMLAFYGTAALLTLLPLTLFTVIALWLRRRIRSAASAPPARSFEFRPHRD